MKTRRILGLLTLLFLTAGFSGCGDKDENKGGTFDVMKEQY